MTGNNNLQKAIADARKARYENGTGGEATFVSGDVAPGKVRDRNVKGEVIVHDDDDGGDDVVE